MSIPTSVLRRARDEANIKQSALAAKLGVSASIISRLEKSDATENAMASKYLRALDTETSKEIEAFYALEWTETERPSFFHPNRQALLEGENALQSLRKFSNSDGFHPLLIDRLGQISDILRTSASYLTQLSHPIAWVGSVGVGKTTALSLLSGLTLPGKGGPSVPIFPATGGRTTICEVEVRVAPAFGIAVVPVPEDRLRLLLKDLVVGSQRSEAGLTTELDRAVRNMADLKRHKGPDGLQIDPVAELVSNSIDADAAVEEILNRIGLSQRTEKQTILSESNENGLSWLSDNISKINYGQHPFFSIPDSITVFLPEGIIRRSDFDVSLIDTKGILGSPLRPDLIGHIRENRTLTVLCSAFNDAPSGEVLKLLREVKALGLDAFERQRVLLLVLPRGEEALKIVDDAGDPPETIDDAYDIRRRQVLETLTAEGVDGVPVIFFNAHSDNATATWKRLSEQVGSIRQRQLERINRYVQVAGHFLANPNSEKIEQARLSMMREAQRIASSYRELPPQVRTPEQELLEELDSGHPSSIAAAISRRGSWPNFPIDYYIGAGVSIDANLRTADFFLKIRGRFDSLREDFLGMPEIEASLDTLDENLEEWRQDFLGQVLVAGQSSFKPYLETATDLWEQLGEYWGQGAGYRLKVFRDIKDWFHSTPTLATARRRTEDRIAELWLTTVLERLVHSTRVAVVVDT